MKQPLQPQTLGQLSSPAVPSISPARAKSVPSAKAAQRILLSLMVPSMLMPLISSMSGVAMPVIREYFHMEADMVAWVTTAFTLPFMILMPVYGRLSDGLGKRRLIMAGIVIFSIGTAIALLAPNLAWLMAGRVIQGIGVSGIMPLGMALISSIFKAGERGRALGTWSSIGPFIAFLGPLFAGFLIARWGWRAAFTPVLLVGVIALIVVYYFVPAGLSNIKPRFLRTFDWLGAVLLTTFLTSLLFFLSSRPITGVPPLQDWRLLGSTTLLLGTFFWWERRQADAFVDLSIFNNKLFSMASLTASTRMFIMAGMGFLMPLYLVDVYNFSPTYLGLMLMINPGAMALIVRFGGQIADRWGSRWPVLAGLLVQISVMVLLAQLSATSPIWILCLILTYHGLGVGLMLAALHQAAMGNISEAEMGGAAGLYSMIRFCGMVIGTALAGVLLQQALDQQLTSVAAYQRVFIIFACIGALGLLPAFRLKIEKNG